MLPSLWTEWFGRCRPEFSDDVSRRHCPYGPSPPVWEQLLDGGLPFFLRLIETSTGERLRGVTDPLAPPSGSAVKSRAFRPTHLTVSSATHSPTAATSIDRVSLTRVSTTRLGGHDDGRNRNRPVPCNHRSRTRVHTVRSLQSCRRAMAIYARPGASYRNAKTTFFGVILIPAQPARRYLGHRPCGEVARKFLLGSPLIFTDLHFDLTASPLFYSRILTSFLNHDARISSKDLVLYFRFHVFTLLLNNILYNTFHFLPFDVQSLDIWLRPPIQWSLNIYFKFGGRAMGLGKFKRNPPPGRFWLRACDHARNYETITMKKQRLLWRPAVLMRVVRRWRPFPYELSARLWIHCSTNVFSAFIIQTFTDRFSGDSV